MTSRLWHNLTSWIQPRLQEPLRLAGNTSLHGDREKKIRKGEDMTNQIAFRVTLERAHLGPLGRYVDSFAEWLSQQGYAAYTLKYRIRLTGALSRFMHQQGLAESELDEKTTVAFLQCRGIDRRIHRDDVPTLRCLMEHLRQSGVILPATPVIDESEMSRITGDFAEYLTRERRLSKVTLPNYLPTVRLLLKERFGACPIVFAEITPADISRFVLRHAPTFSCGRAKLMVTALRSFFRFLHLRGDITVDLAAAVPTVANWRLATLPKWIPPEQVERLRRSCDQHTTAGRRNYAILLLLARLGLRSAEVVALTLDDIDWEAGEISIRGKSRRSDRLPLPHDVGEALVGYLRHGRPRCSTRQVFVRMKGPHRGFLGSAAVYSLVKRAFGRAGLAPVQKGPHVLRHSLATTMLRKGASLREIGEILRHRELATTQIYAKVDLGSLRTIAQAWPGGEV
jgi:site-specific recombinase XerD